jgi:hypothetical protein
MADRDTAITDDWVVSEFRHMDLNDGRLLERFIVTAQLLAAHPLDNINKACGSWAASKGAYRLFDNSKLQAHEIFESHQAETQARIQGQPLVFAIQDTTFLDFDSHPKTKGLGSIAKGYGIKDKLGLILHPTLMITPAGLPLGLTSLSCWARPPRAKMERNERRRQDYRKGLDQRESRKWLLAARETAQNLPAETRCIVISDRESDMFELFHECMSAGQGFVIRSRINRRTQRNKYRTNKMWELLDKLPAAGTSTIEIPAQQGRPAREARVEIKFHPITTPLRENLRCGYHRQVHGMPDEISFFAIKLIEIDPPSDEEKLDWTLVTSEPVTTLDEALEKIEWYKLRWQIEIFFRILKSGCRVEASRLTDANRLQKYIALMAVIAWRIFFLDQVARKTPDAPCTQVLTDDEWKVLYSRIHLSNKLPKKQPTIREAIRWIARLGGFLDRKGDGEPGPLVLWRGWQVLQEMVPLWMALQPP